MGKIRIIKEKKNYNNSDIEDLEIISDTESESNLFRPYRIAEEGSDSEESAQYCLPKKRRHTLESDNEDQADNEQHLRPKVWYANKDNTFAENPPLFVSPCEINEPGSTPYSYFIQIFTNDIFEHIVKETIQYAIYCKNNSFSVTVAEMKKFYAINIIMTYMKCPNYRSYWSVGSTLLPIIAETMSLKRFEEIKRYLHYANNDEIPNGCEDIFIKVRPLLDMLSETFAKASAPAEYQTIDEMIIPFKGKTISKQFDETKAKKLGFKVWVRASQDGYVSKFEMYQKSSTVTTQYGATGDTVVRLCEGLEDKNHKLYLNKLFTSIPLVNHLKTKGIFVVGTIKKNRIYEASRKLDAEKDLQKRGRGSFSAATSSDNVTIVRWHDENIVHMISTYAGVEPKDNVQRWDRKKKKYVSITRPYAVKECNKFVRGVDMSDRMVAHYPQSRKSKKFYHKVAFQFLNVSIVNSWILFNRQNNKMPLLDFKASVATALIKMSGQSETGSNSQGDGCDNDPNSCGSSVPPKKSKTWTRVDPDVRLDGIGHYPKKRELKNPPRCHDKNCVKRTRYVCKKCEEPVCPSCMESFHS